MAKTKIGLIAMSGVRIQSPELMELGVSLPGFVKRGQTIATLPSLGILTVAGLTPPEYEVHYIEIDKYSCDLPMFDLVGISSLAAQIHEAYAIADYYRGAGVKVVMGGLHVSMMPDEALQHADAVVINGAEGAWPKLLEDFSRGQMQKKYYGAKDKVFSPQLYTKPRFDLLQNREYSRLTIQTSRGCPRNCDFCAASLLISERFNQKPIDLIIDEIRTARKYFSQPFFEFADDNTFLNKAWSKDFLQQLQREEIRYFTETDASVAEDTQLCDLISQSGCRQVLIGFESPNEQHLEGIDPVGWKKKQAPKIRKVVDTLQSRGIGVIACFILGLDHHTPEIFPQVWQFVQDLGAEDVQFTVLTPFPGTPLFDRLKKEGRLLKERFWESCTLFDVNYQPQNMSVQELEQGMHWLFSQAYTEDAYQKRKQHFKQQRSSG
ncbi:B12-binding domain-containing radical SAM protein [Candidatus Uabimicrobium amorphum]|uniref:B12-binding domain-containing radical SAMprotein n=1 Tax=Uabimicrobium amorphum TaxID=2596890 RepID=A0A5S9IP25_UABAM|nr:radical SAM protein [Candidatus Uabimicrobium amorphum]BBM84085.1 B12-binding domain-containing radical SAMprotein [Candidatus Uabimicrobium amorphum]